MNLMTEIPRIRDSKELCLKGLSALFETGLHGELCIAG